jgi:hypothetical protein
VSVVARTWRGTAWPLAIALGLALGGCGGPPVDCGVAADAGPAPDVVHADPELESRFPDTVAGRPLEMQSICATHLDSGGLHVDEAFLDSVGVELEDVTIAFGPSPSIGDPNPYVQIMAWRYRGASADALRTAFVDALRAQGEEVEEVQVAGRVVQRSTGIYFHFADDAIFSLNGDDAPTEEVLRSLP